ncbi:hypothetical protein I7I51_02605 [Histoplasma capsulatum]|uniref:Uncharacterized protein n=1 Tax=Ajellomyces capsulatus TaxID=5037 RepID=A0A8A1MEC7_AJECA|nr:predicted protein [Histoplasma mississippiense (nom. inval.)]EDN04323.1 predicted protein [Histoplasma mississippiense (nom. inval.)]QSS62862.1 hypothetical protein I7I51_02605 [Histoplasma capsulatum]
MATLYGLYRMAATWWMAYPWGYEGGLGLPGLDGSLSSLRACPLGPLHLYTSFQQRGVSSLQAGYIGDENGQGPQWPKGHLTLREAPGVMQICSAVPFLVLEPITADEQEWPYIQAGHENGNLQPEASAMLPINFAAAMGRLTRNFATWRSERVISL